MRMLIALVLLMASTGATWVDGYWYDGNKLYKMCLDNQGSRASYVAGVTDARSEVSEILSWNEIYCLPSNATPDQVGDVVIIYLRDHPEQRQFAGPRLVFIALTKAFPCK